MMKCLDSGHRWAVVFDEPLGPCYICGIEYDHFESSPQRDCDCKQCQLLRSDQGDEDWYDLADWLNDEADE